MNRRLLNLANRLIFCVLIISFFSCSSSRLTSSGRKPEIKNVILMIGDGMGIADVTAAIAVSQNPLNIERCTSTGMQKTSSSDNYITDSAASGTALATGVKTKNGSIGVDSQGKPVKTILEIAESNQLATGLVSTSSITHATPASFIAHQSSRGSYEDIALDFLKTDVDVFIGGGSDNFAKRKDKLNLIDSLKSKGYEVNTSIETVLKSDAPKVAGLNCTFS